MCIEKSPWEKAVEFHGHACPGLAIGYKAAEAALSVLGYARDIDEEIVTVVENDSCAIDAIQSILGCTAGKGNLIFRNHGKQVYTVGRRKDGKAVRISLRFNAMSGASGESKEDVIERIIHADIKELFETSEVNLDLPGRAVIFKTVQCSQCGEGVMESKARVSEGRIVCPDCIEEYSRGW
ncbi:MAG: FmdE family protein [Eubacteriales bacterium]|nr:FmdE family protein [Bacillota bacterium]